MPDAPGRRNLLGSMGESPGIIWDLQGSSRSSFEALARGFRKCGNLLGGLGESGDYRGFVRLFAVLFRGAVRGLAVVLENVSIDWNAVGWSSARRSRARETAGRHG